MRRSRGSRRRKYYPLGRIILKHNGKPVEKEPGVWPWKSAHISDQESPDTLDLWTPPRYCKADTHWRYQVGYLLRFALLRGPDFTANVSRRRPRPERHYRSAVSSWVQRKYGNYDGQSAFGGDWLPLSDWFERFLAALLWWPGRKRDGHGRVVDRGIAPTKAWVEDRIELLEKHVGEATKVQFLPMSFSSSYIPKGLKTLRGAVVQTTYPAPVDFTDDLKLSSEPARSRHRDHLTKALALVRQSLRLQEPGPPNGRPKLDLLILPELSIHPDDIERYLKPFVRAFKTIVLAGVAFEALRPEKEELVNTAVWIIPEYSATNGWNVRSRRQGKLNLMALEDGRQQDGHPVAGYRPCQWIIECPASRATVKPLRLSASVCYDATDLGIVADLRERADVYLIPGTQQGCADLRRPCDRSQLSDVPTGRSRQQRPLRRQQRLLAHRRTPREKDHAPSRPGSADAGLLRDLRRSRVPPRKSRESAEALLVEDPSGRLPEEVRLRLTSPGKPSILPGSPLQGHHS